jgi:alcohol dehydrogenase (cytochrome c)
MNERCDRQRRRAPTHTEELNEMRKGLPKIATLGVCLVAAVALLTAAGGSAGATTAGCLLIKTARATSASASTTAPGSASWSYSNGDLTNTRVATGSTISSINVSKLKQAWTFKLSGQAAKGVSPFGALSSNPIVENGLVYFQDLDADVYAVALATGKLRWEYQCDQPETSGPGPDGVAVVGGRVYGQTGKVAFALDASTGRTVWVNSHLLNSGQGSFGIQPQVANGRVYLASQYGSGSGGGVLLALNASTGAKLWQFNTVLSADAGVPVSGAGSGGAWETPLVSSDGSVTFGIGNPYQTPASAIAHPASQLYTDSDVSLNAATGKLRWYYQGVTNDFKDYDMQTSPIAASAGGAAVVIGSGKMGYVYEMNAKSGKLIWKTPVGEHNGHDNDSLLALEHKPTTIRAPYTILPGPVGGVLTNPALVGNTLYVVTVDWALTYPNLNLPIATKVAGLPTGEVEALNVTTGKVEWDTKVPQMPLGAATVSNDLIFTTLYNGVLIALNRHTGEIVYRQRLPASANAPLAIAGDTVIVPAGGPTQLARGGVPQVVAYTDR